MLTAGPRRATVVNNVDPEGMGRLTVRVEGMIDESEWALPFGVGMTTGQGAWNIPPVGALIWVMFEGGDIDSPVWAHGPWTKPATEAQVPEDAVEAQEEDPTTAHLLRTFETAHFKITCDERPGPTGEEFDEDRKEYLRLVHKDTGDFVELDGVKRGIYLKSTGSIVLEALGLIQLSAAHIQFNDRLVQWGSHTV